MTNEQQTQLTNALRRATLLTEQEWRTIHNSLSVYQHHFEQAAGYPSHPERVKQIQQLMDKVRDNFISDHAINEQAKAQFAAMHSVLNSALDKTTIRRLVELVDELRQPYNNSKRHDLYLLATNKLNDLEDREELVR